MRFKIFYAAVVLVLACLSIFGFMSVYSDIEPETRQFMLPFAIAALTLTVGVFLAIFPLNQGEMDQYRQPSVLNWIGALMGLAFGWYVSASWFPAQVGTDLWWDFKPFGGNTSSEGYGWMVFTWLVVTIIISALAIKALLWDPLVIPWGNYNRRLAKQRVELEDGEFLEHVSLTVSPDDPPDSPKSFDAVIDGIIDHLTKDHPFLVELIRRWATPHRTGILPTDTAEVKKGKTTTAARKGFCTALWNLRERQLRVHGNQVQGPAPASFTEKQEWELLKFGEELLSNFLLKQHDKDGKNTNMLLLVLPEMEIAQRLSALRDIHGSMLFPNNAGGDITFMAAYDEAHAAGVTAFRATPPSDNLPWASVLVSFAKLFETGVWHGPQTVPANFFQLEAFRRFSAELDASIPVLRLEKARNAFIELVTKRGLTALATLIAGKSALDFGKWVWQSHFAAVEETRPLPEVARVEGRKELADGVDEILAKGEEFIDALKETFDARAQALCNSMVAKAKARGLLKLEDELKGMTPEQFASTVMLNFSASVGSIPDFTTANAKGRKALIDAVAKILNEGDSLKKAFSQFKMAEDIDIQCGTAYPVSLRIDADATTLLETLRKVRAEAIRTGVDPFVALCWYAHSVVTTDERDPSVVKTSLPSDFTMDKGFADLKALCGPEGWAILKKWEDGVTFIRSKAKNGKLNAEIGRAMNLTDTDASKHLSEAEAAWKTIDGSPKPKSVPKDRQRAFLLKLHERLSAPEQKPREGRQPPVKKI